MDLHLRETTSRGTSVACLFLHCIVAALVDFSYAVLTVFGESFSNGVKDRFVSIIGLYPTVLTWCLPIAFYAHTKKRYRICALLSTCAIGTFIPIVAALYYLH